MSIVCISKSSGGRCPSSTLGQAMHHPCQELGFGFGFRCQCQHRPCTRSFSRFWYSMGWVWSAIMSIWTLWTSIGAGLWFGDPLWYCRGWKPLDIWACQSDNLYVRSHYCAIWSDRACLCLLLERVGLFFPFEVEQNSPKRKINIEERLIVKKGFAKRLRVVMELHFVSYIKLYLAHGMKIRLKQWIIDQNDRSRNMFCLNSTGLVLRVLPLEKWSSIPPNEITGSWDCRTYLYFCLPVLTVSYFCNDHGK